MIEGNKQANQDVVYKNKKGRERKNEQAMLVRFITLNSDFKFEIRKCFNRAIICYSLK